MPSPFPGMDPYLEKPLHWPDVHHSLITYIRNALQPQIRPGYHARIEERVYITESSRTLYPDVFLIRRPVPVAEPVTVAAGMAAPRPEVRATGEIWSMPLFLTLPPDRQREPFVEIVYTAGGEVVTVIEVLSPANKRPGKGRRIYLRKQEEILDSLVHLVEIDLLSEGPVTVAFSEWGEENLLPHRYVVSVRRGPIHRGFEAYPIRLRDRLPNIRVPLRAPDPDVGLDLQAVFTQCYDDGDYAYLVDYRKPPPVSFSARDMVWMDGLLKEKGLRNSSA